MSLCPERAYNGYVCCAGNVGHEGPHTITNGGVASFTWGGKDGGTVRIGGGSYELNRELDFEAAKKKWEDWTVNTAAEMVKEAAIIGTSVRKLPIEPEATIKVHAVDGIPRDTIYAVGVDYAFRNDDQVDAIKYTMGLTAPKENDNSFLERMMEDAYRAIGISRLPKLADHPPAGITSGIALKAYYDAEIEALTKKIQEGHSTIYPKGPRKPAMDGRQETARPGVAYRIYDNIHRDDVLIVAESIENPGWGRMVLVPGQLFVMWKRRASAPVDEVALTDDDLETAICQLAGKGSMHFQPWDPVTTDDEAEELRVAYHELTRELFFSDLELQEHVAKNADIPFAADAEHGPQFGEKMHAAMEHAWKLATDWCERRKRAVEHACYCRSARRASRILNTRRLEEG